MNRGRGQRDTGVEMQIQRENIKGDETQHLALIENSNADKLTSTNDTATSKANPLEIFSLTCAPAAEKKGNSELVLQKLKPPLHLSKSNHIKYLDIIHQSFSCAQSLSDLQEIQPTHQKQSFSNKYHVPEQLEHASSNSNAPSKQDSDLLPPRESVTKKRKSNRRYDCKFEGCVAFFTTSGHLTRHFKIHTGEKAHACPILHCASIFSRKDNMLQHFTAHQKKLASTNTPILFKEVNPVAATESKQHKRAKKDLQWHRDKHGLTNGSSGYFAPPATDKLQSSYNQDQQQYLRAVPFPFQLPTTTFLSTFPLHQSQHQFSNSQRPHFAYSAPNNPIHTSLRLGPSKSTKTNPFHPKYTGPPAFWTQSAPLVQQGTHTSLLASPYNYPGSQSARMELEYAATDATCFAFPPSLHAATGYNVSGIGSPVFAPLVGGGVGIVDGGCGGDDGIEIGEGFRYGVYKYT